MLDASCLNVHFKILSISQHKNNCQAQRIQGKPAVFLLNYTFFSSFFNIHELQNICLRDFRELHQFGEVFNTSRLRKGPLQLHI